MIEISTKELLYKEDCSLDLLCADIIRQLKEYLSSLEFDKDGGLNAT